MINVKEVENKMFSGEYEIPVDKLAVDMNVYIPLKRYVTMSRSVTIFCEYQIIKISPKRTKITLKNKSGNVECLKSTDKFYYICDELTEYSSHMFNFLKVYKDLSDYKPVYNWLEKISADKNNGYSLNNELIPILKYKQPDELQRIVDLIDNFEKDLLECLL